MQLLVDTFQSALYRMQLYFFVGYGCANERGTIIRMKGRKK